MSDILRGIATTIIDGDTFDLQVLETTSPDKEKYDTVERIRINSLSDDIESTETVEDGFEETDEDEMMGTPEEAAIEAGSANTTRFFDIRDPEDLEAHIKGRTVSCSVRERTTGALILADVTVL